MPNLSKNILNDARTGLDAAVSYWERWNLAMNDNPKDLIPTRVSLLQKLKEWDDQESWRRFFETYWKLLYAVAVRSGLNEPEAQDVVQETVIAVAKKMKNFRYDPAVDSFKGWLLYHTRKRIAMHFRRRQRERQRRMEGPDADGSCHADHSQDGSAAGCPVRSGDVPHRGHQRRRRPGH